MTDLDLLAAGCLPQTTIGEKQKQKTQSAYLRSSISHFQQDVFVAQVYGLNRLVDGA